ncbi:helix-turn-helix domain-containing protein [Flavobacterium johnsoniae]|uniref:Transcriptional regulator, AraC family n=1 Tax=Flavobacterium johnsoniae (strain ATCC 17061 / DSM 2064 / JCM 8514 / BCRC 14874 / CCUG 350202 / NBRC 14942 / NCIMB 11054 / UW101) TaxID=376686 RepID=A5FMK0_FLAJ1|nr:helix-turn-helix domain-containing protein [Flavobacterium johnsoniae]ABQ03573.1 transcriptional regulator, AraC family [Flavobacterium johnsoniae UW101]OXE95995.1 DNA-binding protein [Flavobacterium johnsoniae UW101]WQG79563.1 helix-turn-helix domain-containing protein [Flavobacterium johnsoniae UW101]SHL96041.1 transcriptional regulator, AraC family [Flavobacterium johnsoniae]
MDTGKELLFFFSALGSFNGIILGVYFFFFTKKKFLTNYFLGALLFALSIRIGKSVFIYFHPELPKMYLQLGLTACFFIGPCLYYFLRSAVEEINVMPKSWKMMLLFWGILIVSVGILYPYEMYPTLWSFYFIRIIYFQWFVYILFSGFTIRGVLKKIFNTKEKASPSEIWFGTLFLGTFLLFLFYFLAIMGASAATYISGAVVFSFILYLIISILLYRKKTDDLFLLNSQKVSGKKIDAAEAVIISEKLENIMNEKSLYKNPNLNLQDLSREINISSHQLSQFLNNNLGKNFTSFVNEFRINEACRIITSNDKLTLESVGYDVGFNSKSTFFAAFKKHTGTTPLNYQLQALQT